MSSRPLELRLQACLACEQGYSFGFELIKFTCCRDNFALQSLVGDSHVPASNRHGLQHVHARAVRILPRMLNVAYDIEGTELYDLNGNVRTLNKADALFEPICNFGRQLGSGRAGCGNLSEQWQR